MSKLVTRLLKATYRPSILRDRLSNGEEVFVAFHPSFRGLLTQAATIEEAEGEWCELLDERLAELDIAGLPIPKPDYFVYEQTFSMDENRTTKIVVETQSLSVENKDLEPTVTDEVELRVKSSA